MVHVLDAGIAEVALLRDRAAVARLYTSAFVAVYAAAIHFGMRIGDAWVFVPVCVAVAALLHLLLFLSRFWSVRIRAALDYRPARSLPDATYIMVLPAPHCGTPAICPLVRDGASISFMLHKFKYNWEEGRRGFVKLTFPVGLPLPTYLEARGHGSPADLQAAELKWGNNALDLPLPTFGELFKQHAVAPFFVFQLVCVGLWCLDEYWYFSLFTLFMLVMFECTVVQQRLRNMATLRAMRRPPFAVYVFRGKRWTQVSSYDVVPGDLVSVGKLKAMPPPNAPPPPPPPPPPRNPREAALQRLFAKPRPPPPEPGVVPCDVLLLEGNCVVNEALLTGESAPLRKEGLASADVAAPVEGREAAEEGGEPRLALEGPAGQRLRKHVLFGGTQILQHEVAASEDGEAPAAPAAAQALPGVPRPPDGGCAGYALRTGFYTTQGELMRTFLYASEPVHTNNWETFLFILFLLCFALLAAGYVLYHGLQDLERSRWKLTLHCIMVVTSVVPPELPMELALAVQSSLAALFRMRIFCTEPFRIPMAGDVHVCCFDKTGTLTSDDLVVSGVVVEAPRGEGAGYSLVEASAAQESVALVLAGCHSLVRVEGEVTGDPMEKAALQACGWTLRSSHEAVPSTATGAARGHPAVGSMRVLLRHDFSSDLKRMSTVVAVERLGSRGRQVWALCKGAPEVVEQHLRHVPAWFRPAYLHHMRSGKRVLALAARRLDVAAPGDAHDASALASVAAGGNVALMARAARAQLTRADAERALQLAGLLVLDCPLKSDSAAVVAELREASHGVVMITGDNALTACAVARDVSMVPAGKPTLVLWRAELAAEAGADGPAETEAASLHTAAGASPDAAAAYWCPLEVTGDPEAEAASRMPFRAAELPALARTHVLCATGPALDALTQGSHAGAGAAGGSAAGGSGGTDAARAEQVAQRKVLSALAPLVTVWARVSPAHKELVVSALKASGRRTLMCGDGTNDVGALKQADVGVSVINSPALEKKQNAPAAGAAASTAAARVATDARSRKRAPRWAGSGSTGAPQQMQGMLDSVQAEDDVQLRFGDASIASPFTCKTPSVRCTVDILRQGRCALVTTLQMFRILALNCLITAFSLSVIHFHGVKNGDQQMTVAGMGIAAFFLLMSRAKPLDRLSRLRPPSRIFSWYLILTVTGQALVHVGALAACLKLCEPYVDRSDPALQPDGEFAPNVINSAVFLLSTWLQVNTFVANYRGRPFMESIRENKALLRAAVACYAVLALALTGVSADLNDLLQLTDMPSTQFRLGLIGVVAADTALSVGIARLCVWFFEERGQPRD